MALRNTTMWGSAPYGMDEDLAPDKNGMVRAPTEPGIGGQIDFGLIKRKTEAGGEPDCPARCVNERLIRVLGAGCSTLRARLLATGFFRGRV